MAKTTKRRRGKKRTGGAKLNKKQTKQVKQIINKNLELKYYDATLGPFGQPNTWQISGISSIPQGQTDSSRIGDKLKMTRWQLRVQFDLSGGSLADATNHLRFVCFQWKPFTIPVVADIFNLGLGAAEDNFSFYQHDKKANYHILFDREYFLAGNGFLDTNDIASVGCCTSKYVFLSIPLKRAIKQIDYIAGGVTGNNKLYIATCSDSSVTPHPVISIQSHIEFYDG